MRRIAPFAPLFVLALVAAGCTKTSVTHGGVVRTKPITSIVTLSPALTEIVGGVGASNLLKGRTQADNWPEYVVKTVPVVATIKPDFEKIRAIKPDVIAVDEDLYSESDIAKLESLGSEVIRFNPQTIQEYIRQVSKLAGSLGQESTISSYLDKVTAAAEVASAEAGESKPKVAVVMSGDMVAGTGGFLGDVLKTAGAVPVGPGGRKFERFGAEALVAAAPDVIIVPVDKKATAGSAAKLTALAKDPRFASIPAVKSRHIYALDQDVVLRRGYRVNTLIEGVRRVLDQSRGER